MKLSKLLIILLIVTQTPTEAWSQENEAEIAAKGQLEAYNRQDIEGFLKWYSDDVEIFNFPDELIIKGKDKMRERYVNAWKLNPGQRAEVTNRIINGSTVVDREHVTGRANSQEVNVLAIYRVEKGKIIKVYFIRD